MMKKLSALLLAFSVIFSSVGAAAETIDFKQSETVEIKLHKDEKELSVVDKSKAALDVEILYNGKDFKDYDVFCSIDGKKAVKLADISVEPGKKTKKTVSIGGLKNGIFNLKAWVERDGERYGEFETKLNVMQEYEHKFMDEYNPMGVCTSYTIYDTKGTNPWWPKAPTDKKSADYVKYAGFGSARSTVPFDYINKSLGSEDLSRLWYLDQYKDKYGPKLHNLINGMNNLDDPRIALDEDMPEGNSPRTQGAIEAYKDRVLRYMKVYPEGKRYELWNEANIAFWTPVEGNSTDYPNLLKQTYVAMKKERPDLEISSASTGPQSNTKSHITFTDEMFKNGSYPYMDAVTWHYYVTGGEVENGHTFENYLKEVTDVPLKYGGWKVFHCTELGFYNTSYNTEEEGANKLLKAYMFAQKHGTESLQFYCLANTGLEAGNPEHNYGIMDNDQNPKLAYIAAGAFNNELAGAVYAGQLDMGDENTYGFVYLADGKPVLVTWYYDNDKGSKELDFEGESVTVKDYLGNVKQTKANSTKIGYEYVFVEGLSDEWLKKAVCDSVTEKQNAWLKDYSDVCTPEILTSANEVFESTVLGVSKGESAEEIFDSYQALGEKIIKAMANGEISQLDASKMTYELYRAAEHLNAYYIATYNGEMPKAATADRARAKKLEAERYLDKDAIMQYSASIMNFAEKYYEKVNGILNDIDNPSKAGAASGYDRMAKMLYAWFEDFSAAETPDNYYEFYINVKGCDTYIWNGNAGAVRYDLVNNTKNDIKGHIDVYDENGEYVSSTEEVSIKAGKYSSCEADVEDGISDGVSKKNYTFKFVDNLGNVIKEQNVVFNVQNSLKMELLPCNTTVDSLKSIRLKATNSSDSPLSIKVKVSGGEDIKLGLSETDVTIDENGEQIIEIPVTSIVENQYHTYSVSYEVIYDGVTLCSAEELLSFAVALRANETIDVKGFDGDISAWRDAYPIHFGQPNNASSKDEWSKSTLSARALIKYDDSNLYMLVDVYDDVHYLFNTGSTMWQNDSLQISIDALNDDAKSYAEDDYELGIALGLDKVVYGIQWQGDADMSTAANWTSAIRDDEKHLTRYLIALPTSVVTKMTLADGGELAFNIAVNDADNFNRDRYIEFTGGTASTKNPSLYESFKLINLNLPELKASIASDIFPVDLK